jgi:hypothetical protein
MGERSTPVDTLTPSITHEDGRMVPRPHVPGGEGSRPTGAPEQQVPAAPHAGLEGDRGGEKQDAPAKPKTASSRQQMKPAQGTQTGDTDLDAGSPRGRSGV